MRRLRAVATIALLWAAASLPIGLAWAVLRALDNSPTDRMPGYSSLEDALLFLLFWEGWALLSGAVFAALVAGFEARREVGSLSHWRFAMWGAAGSLALPVVLTIREAEYFSLSWRWYLLALGISGAYGALCALGMLRLVRPRRSAASA